MAVAIAERGRKNWIPQVSKERIEELAKRIKPVVRMLRFTTITKKIDENTIRFIDKERKSAKLRSTWDDRGDLYYIRRVNLFNVAYTWGPTATRKAEGLKPLCDITTYHGYGYHGLFKPSIAEVLAQIPEEHLGDVVAFEIIEHPETWEDFNKNREAFDDGYHTCVTRLYTRG